MKQLGIGLVFLFLLPLHVFAACTAKGYTVVYVNGILTSKQDAEIDKENLKKVFQADSKIQDVDFLIGYNASHLAGFGDWLKSIEQTYQQKDGEYVSDYDLTTILLQLYPEITTRRLLLVGHSQGTFYSNELYNYLTDHGFPAADIAVYNLATPAAYVAGGGNYLTSSNDQLVKSVRALAARVHAPAPLLPNIVLPLAPGEEEQGLYAGHSISDDYLAHAPDRIVADVDRALSKLELQFVGSGTGDCFTPPSDNWRYKLESVNFKIADPISGLAYSLTKLNYQLYALQLQLEVRMAQAAYRSMVGLGHAAVSALANLGHRISEATHLLMELTASRFSAATAFAPDIFSGNVVGSASASSFGEPPAAPAPQPAPEPAAPASAAADSQPPARVAVSETSSASPASPEAPKPAAENPSAPPATPPPASSFGPNGPASVVIIPGFGGGAPPSPPPEPEPPPAPAPEPPAEEATSTSAATSTAPAVSLAVLAPADGASFSTSTVLFSGTTTPSASVVANYAGLSSTTAADGAGDWSLVLELPEGTTTVSLEALDASSGASTTLSISVGISLPPLAPSGPDAGWFCAPDTETVVDESSNPLYQPGSGDCTYLSYFLADGISRTVALYRGAIGSATAVAEHQTALASYEALSDAIPADATDGEPFFVAMWKVATSTDNADFESYFSTGSTTAPSSDYKVLPFTFGTAGPPILN